MEEGGDRMVTVLVVIMFVVDYKKGPRFGSYNERKILNEENVPFLLI